MEAFEKKYYELLSNTKKILINNLDKNDNPTKLLNRWYNVTCKNDIEK